MGVSGSVITTLIGFIAGGGLLKLFQVFQAGFRERARAKDKRLSRMDRALMSRLLWRDHAFQVRATVRGAVDVELPPLPEDPYTESVDSFIEEEVKTS